MQSTCMTKAGDISGVVQAKLLGYLRETVSGFPDVSSIAIKQFSHGQSNPTYLLEVCLCAH